MSISRCLRARAVRIAGLAALFVLLVSSTGCMVYRIRGVQLVGRGVTRPWSELCRGGTLRLEPGTYDVRVDGQFVRGTEPGDRVEVKAGDERFHLDQYRTSASFTVPAGSGEGFPLRLDRLTQEDPANRTCRVASVGVHPILRHVNGRNYEPGDTVPPGEMRLEIVNAGSCHQLDVRSGDNVINPSRALNMPAGSAPGQRVGLEICCDSSCADFTFVRGTIGRSASAVMLVSPRGREVALRTACRDEKVIPLAVGKYAVKVERTEMPGEGREAMYAVDGGPWTTLGEATPVPIAPPGRNTAYERVRLGLKFPAPNNGWAEQSCLIEARPTRIEFYAGKEKVDHLCADKSYRLSAHNAEGCAAVQFAYGKETWSEMEHEVRVTSDESHVTVTCDGAQSEIPIQVKSCSRIAKPLTPPPPLLPPPPPALGCQYPESHVRYNQPTSHPQPWRLCRGSFAECTYRVDGGDVQFLTAKEITVPSNQRIVVSGCR